MKTDPALKRLTQMARRKKGFTRDDVIELGGTLKTRPGQPRLVPSRVLRQIAAATGAKAVIEKVKGEPKRYRLEA